MRSERTDASSAAQQGFDLAVVATLERRLDRETLPIPADRRDRQHAARTTVDDHGITFLGAAYQVSRVPRVGVPDVRQPDVVVLAPEERHIPERCSEPEHVMGDSLTLALSHDPMLDANRRAEPGLGIAR